VALPNPAKKVALPDNVELLIKVALKLPLNAVEFAPIVELSPTVELKVMVSFIDTSLPVSTVLMIHGALTNRPYLDRG